MPEIRVTVDKKLDLLLDLIVDAGLYPSKAELLRSGLIHLLKDLGLLQNMINETRGSALSTRSIPVPKDKLQKIKKRKMVIQGISQTNNQRTTQKG